MEHRKVKFGLTVTSSEKADSFNRYFHAGFSLLALPYPGVECFRNFKDNGHCARQLNVDWTQGFADANLSLPMDDLPEVLSEIDWRSYKKWDLVRLTQTYLKLFIKCIEQPSKGEDDLGLLIHCISGWDRTPLFVSLLRLSLWADGEIHTSLSPAEMLYFTIGYDWLLFSHLLADRTSRGEDIFLFCFYFLQFVMTDDFAITPRVPPKTLDTANPKPPPDAEAPNLQVGSWQMVSLANSLSTTPERARIDKPDSPLGLDINEGPKKSPVGVFHRTSAPRPIVREMGAIGSWSRNTITSSNSNEAVAIGSPHTQHNASRPHSLTHQNSFAKVSVPSHTPSPHSMDSFGKISFEEARNRNRKSSSLPESPLSTTPDSPMFDEFITGTTPPTLLSHMETKSSRSSSLIVPSPSSGHLKSRKSLISIQSESSLASSFASVQFSKSTSINNIANVEQSGGAYLLSKCQCCVDETPQVDISTCFKPVELPVESNVTDETGYMETEHMENIPNMRQEKLQAIRFLFSQIHGEYISGMQEQVQEKKRSDLESLSAVVPQIPPTIGGGTVSTIWNWMSSSQTENSTTAEESSGKAASPKKYASLSRRFSSPSLVIGKSGGDSDASESHLSQEPVLHRDADMKEERPKNSHFTRPTLVLASQQYRQQRSRIGFTGPKRRTNSPPEVSGQQATFENVTMQQHSSVSTAYSSPMSNPVSKEKERGEKVTGSPVPETTRKTSENLKRSASAKRSGASSQGSGTGSFKDWYRK
ncbi:Myotubularin- protein 14 [Nowakowskiella sp. JEL0407]|nr:Myotubularin- protein 14 [Nowakowskiella sp. JEL0407]